MGTPTPRVVVERINSGRIGQRLVTALRRDFGPVLASLPTETHIREMARQSETRMWDEFRALDTRRQELTKLLDKLEDREADSCERADRIDRKVFRLTRKYGRLLQDKEETEEWVAEVENLGGETPEERKRKRNARQALEAIMREIHQLSARASALDEKRWRWRYEEHKAEDGQYEIGENIERLKADLEAVLAGGGD